MSYAPLTLSEWEQLKLEAHKYFIEKVLPPKPTRKSVAKRITDTFNVNVLEWIMMLLVFVIFIFVGHKGGINSLPYVHTLAERLSENNNVYDGVINSFLIFGIMIYSLLPSVAIIYFKILHDSMKDQRRQTYSRKLLRFIDLDWLTPRLPILIVYLGIGWLFQISWAGERFFFLWLLPVMVEIAGAHLVAKIIVRYRQYREAVTANYVPQLKHWEDRVENYEEEKGFYQALYYCMFDKLANKRVNRAYPNRELFNDPNRIDEVNEIILSEFRRWNSGLNFANSALDLSEEVREEIKAEYVLDLPRDRDGKFIPPEGAERWTEATLRDHLHKRGIKISDVTQGSLDEDYASGTAYRVAYRRLK